MFDEKHVYTQERESKCPIMDHILSYKSKRINNARFDKTEELMKFLENERDDIASMKANHSWTITWSVDEASAVHPDYKCHT